MSDAQTFDIQRIMELIPHRYPLLLVDRLEEINLGESAIGVKNVTFNEPHFQGHFPGAPVMPGVLIVEAMAQTAAALVIATLGADAEGKLVYFMTIDNARFRRQVTPGDQLRMHVTKTRSRATVWKFDGKAYVGDKLAAEASFGAMIAS
ncbi:MAG: 3-hydroxyacyl-ACP dehydratase FabZ [Alphaproteobacteria bacterium]|jgi:3-hydroxyacyl-[acyl-carrier-protein] dehydratase|nr:3-hydroxyacyl-ACP dehydratase FabZ [Alphaproteobacteria bacterium]